MPEMLISLLVLIGPTLVVILICQGMILYDYVQYCRLKKKDRYRFRSAWDERMFP